MWEKSAATAVCKPRRFFSCGSGTEGVIEHSPMSGIQWKRPGGRKVRMEERVKLGVDILRVQALWGTVRK